MRLWKNLRNVMIFVTLLVSYSGVVGFSKKDIAKNIKAKRDSALGQTFQLRYNGPEEKVKSVAEAAGFRFVGKIAGNIYEVRVEEPVKSSRSKVKMQHKIQQLRESDNQVLDLYTETYTKRVKKSVLPQRVKRYSGNANWTDQWNLHNTHSPSMNVLVAWQRGYSGTGINIAVIDDGIDITHTDLDDNFVMENSYDYIFDTLDPAHYYNGEGHGTNCAGLIAAENNTECIIGIGYNSKFAGIRLLDEYSPPTNGDEARALTHKLDVIDIYSNSWGPSDGGNEFGALPSAQEEALKEGVTTGRNGLGAVYTWAAGNGRSNSDDCNADGYANSPYTIAVTSLAPDSLPAWYAEPCAAILCATYGGDENQDEMATTARYDACTDDFQGTSAACPVASGIFALVLQANPSLTWIDVQHIVVETANSADLDSSHNFVTNGAGKTVSLSAGFGLLDATAMIDAALTWNSVPPRITYETDLIDVSITTNVSITSIYTISNSFVNFIEHIEVTAKYQAGYRGDMELYLTSPTGPAPTRLFGIRYLDATSDLVEFRFMSVHQWGEQVNGIWNLTLYDAYGGNVMTFYHWKVKVYGTVSDPMQGIKTDGLEGSTCNKTTPCLQTFSCYETVCVGCTQFVGYTDLGGVCTQNGTEGSVCSDISMCNVGLQCVNGVCQNVDTGGNNNDTTNNQVRNSDDGGHDGLSDATIAAITIGVVGFVVTTSAIALLVYKSVIAKPDIKVHPEMSPIEHTSGLGHYPDSVQNNHCQSYGYSNPATR